MQRCLSFLSALFFVGVAESTQAQVVPQHLTTIDGRSFYHFGSDDHRRYGSVISFSLGSYVPSSAGGGRGVYVAHRYLASCKGEWFTDTLAYDMDIASEPTDAGEVFERMVRKLNPRDLPIPIAFSDKFEIFDGGSQAGLDVAVKRAVTGWCLKAKSRRSDDVPIYQNKVPEVGFLLLRTLQVRRGKTEVWFEDVAISKVQIKDSEGRPMLNGDGTAKVTTSIDTEKPKRKVLFSVGCDDFTFAIKQTVDYDAKGVSTESREFNNLTYKSPIPDSVGEVLVEAVCRMS